MKKVTKEATAIACASVFFAVGAFVGCSKNEAPVAASSDEVVAEDTTETGDEPFDLDSVVDQLPEIEYDYRVYGVRDAENPAIFTDEYFGFKYELDPDAGLDLWGEDDLAMLNGLTTYDTEQIAALIGFNGIGTLYYADTASGDISVKISVTRNNGSDARTLLNWFVTQNYYTGKLDWYGVTDYVSDGIAMDIPRSSGGTFPIAVTKTSGTATSPDNRSYDEILAVFPTQNYAAFIEITSMGEDKTDILMSGLSVIADSIPVEKLTIAGELPTLTTGDTSDDYSMDNPYTAIGDYNSITITQEKFDDLCARYDIVPTKSQTGDDLEWYGNNDDVSFTYAKCVSQITLSDYLAYFYAMLGNSSDQPLCEMYMDQTELARYAVLNDGDDEFLLIGAKNLDTFKNLVEEFGVSFEYDEAVATDNMLKNAELYGTN